MKKANETSSPEKIWEIIQSLPKDRFTIKDVKADMMDMYPELPIGRLYSALSNWAKKGLLRIISLEREGFGDIQAIYVKNPLAKPKFKRPIDAGEVRVYKSKTYQKPKKSDLSSGETGIAIIDGILLMKQRHTAEIKSKLDEIHELTMDRHKLQAKVSDLIQERHSLEEKHKKELEKIMERVKKYNSKTFSMSDLEDRRKEKRD